MPEEHPGRKRRIDADRSVAAILEAAVTLMAASPDASMTDIARAAGVGRVTLYGHFDSRDRLRTAAIDHVVDQVQEAFDALHLDLLPPAQALEQILRHGWRVIERHRAFFVGVMHQPEHEAMHRHQAILHQIEQIIARGQNEGVFRADLPRPWLVAACIGLVHAAVMYADTGQIPPDDAVDALVATVSAACRPN